MKEFILENIEIKISFPFLNFQNKNNLSEDEQNLIYFSYKYTMEAINSLKNFTELLIHMREDNVGQLYSVGIDRLLANKKFGNYYDFPVVSLNLKKNKKIRNGSTILLGATNTNFEVLTEASKQVITDEYKSKEIIIRGSFKYYYFP